MTVRRLGYFLLDCAELLWAVRCRPSYVGEGEYPDGTPRHVFDILSEDGRLLGVVCSGPCGHPRQAFWIPTGLEERHMERYREYMP